MRQLQQQQGGGAKNESSGGVSQTSGNVDVSDTGNTEGAFDGTVLRGGKFIRLFYSDEKMEAESASVKQTSGDGSGQEGQQSEEGGWTRIGNVIGEGARGTFRAGPKIKIEGGDDRASVHLNHVPYKGTFTEIGPDDKPVAGVYPLYEGVLSTALSEAFATDQVFELYGPANTKFDWTFEIVPFEKSCDNCGKPMIKVCEWRE